MSIYTGDDDGRLNSLKEWQDSPLVCLALDKIREGKEPVEVLVSAATALAERLRDAEDYMVIQRLGDKQKDD